jgi:trk system potassium uptake protein TrkA
MAKKRVVVVGLGAFGRECALHLARDCEVLAIDIGQKAVNDLADEVAQARRADARDAEALAELLGDNFDEAIVSLGERLEDSILAVLNLLNLGVKRIHTKVLGKAHAQILKALEAKFSGATIGTVFPEREAAEHLATKILHPNVIESIAMSQGYIICEIATPDKFAGKTLAELQIRRDYGVYVIAIHEHLPDKTLFMPGPNFICKPSDSLIVIGQGDEIKKVQALV